MDLGIQYTRQPDGTKRASIPDRSREWALSFVREHAAKSPAEIAAVVQEGHDRIIRLLDGLTDEPAPARPAADEWSVLDAMAHVVSTKQIMVALIGSLSQGALPPGAGPEWEEESRQDGVTITTFTSVAEARDAANDAQRQLLDLIADIDAANTEMRFKHYIFGAFNAREWCVFQRVHDGDHTPQIERLVGALGKSAT
jgi:hypothetical protein